MKSSSTIFYNAQHTKLRIHILTFVYIIVYHTSIEAKRRLVAFRKFVNLLIISAITFN